MYGKSDCQGIAKNNDNVGREHQTNKTAKKENANLYADWRHIIRRRNQF